MPRNALIAAATTFLMLALLAVSQALPGAVVVVLLLAAAGSAAYAPKATPATKPKTSAASTSSADTTTGGAGGGSAGGTRGAGPDSGTGDTGRDVPASESGRRRWRRPWSGPHVTTTFAEPVLPEWRQSGRSWWADAGAAARTLLGSFGPRLRRNRRGDHSHTSTTAVTDPPEPPGPPGPASTDDAPADSPPSSDPSSRTRRPDGRPETDADRRFFDLRESGYTGWIDQDGYPLTAEEADALHRSWAAQQGTGTIPRPGADGWAWATPPGSPVPTIWVPSERLDRPLGPDPFNSSVPPTSTTDPKETDMAGTVTAISSATGAGTGTGGRAGIAGLIVDWESSQDARRHPETFVTWLLSQAAAADQAATMVPDLASQFHGRGPTGHAGVPEQQLARFAADFAAARNAEAAAYRAWAAHYRAYVDQAEHDLTHSYGREVLAASHAAHRG